MDSNFERLVQWWNALSYFQNAVAKNKAKLQTIESLRDIHSPENCDGTCEICDEWFSAKYRENIASCTRAMNELIRNIAKALPDSSERVKAAFAEFKGLDADAVDVDAADVDAVKVGDVYHWKSAKRVAEEQLKRALLMHELLTWLKPLMQVR